MTFSRCSPNRQLNVSRRRWESNPLDAALQAAATPRDFSVINPVSLPGVEPGLRPSQSRVRPPHSKDSQYPAEESNLARLLRRQSCVLHTRRACNQYPDLELNQGLDLRRVQCSPLHHRDKQGRRLDSHQHDPVYKTGAFLGRATSAMSTSVRIRTPSSSFGGCPLSQEHHSCKAAEPLRKGLGGGRHSSSSTVQYASLRNLDQLSIRMSCRA